MKQFLFGVVGSVLLIPSSVALAQLPCGNIIAPSDWGIGYIEIDAPLETTPITDCASPFGILKSPVSPNRLDVSGVTIENNSTVTIDPEGTKEYKVTYDFTDPEVYYIPILFRHEGDNYRYIRTELVEPTEQEYRALAAMVFSNQTDIDTNVARIMSPDPWEGLVYESPEFNTFENFYDYVDTHFNPNPLLALGTYTFVFKERTNLGGVEPNTYTITFTFAKPTVEPTGASSVLFLPGIQASRLYTDGVLGTENQIWEPNINADVEKLAMTESGESVNEVYTRDVVDEIFGVSNVYRGFLDMLADLKSSNVLASSSAFAYDWRFDVIDIAQSGTQYENEIKSLVAEVERLSASSYTDKVTIIGHSNGGLLGKALITELDRQGKSNLVDKLVMVGTPQLGTPKAIAVMLHGYDQLAVLGKVVDDDTAREVIRNMPGAYGLLSSAEYFEKAGETLVRSDSSNTTASVRIYGDITTQQSLNNFLLDTQNVRPDTVPIYEPATLNAQLLSD